jgi:hypothetical protein
MTWFDGCQPVSLFRSIDQETADRYATLVKKAGPHVAALSNIAAEITELQDTRHQVVSAEITVDPTRGAGAGRSAPTPATVEGVVAAVMRGLDLLAVETERRLGLIDANWQEA